MLVQLWDCHIFCLKYYYAVMSAGYVGVIHVVWLVMQSFISFSSSWYFHCAKSCLWMHPSSFIWSCLLRIVNQSESSEKNVRQKIIDKWQGELVHPNQTQFFENQINVNLHFLNFKVQTFGLDVGQLISFLLHFEFDISI